MRAPKQKVVLDGSWDCGNATTLPVYIIEQNYDYWYEMERADGSLSGDERPKLNDRGLIYYVRLRAIDSDPPWGVDSFGHATIEEAKRWASEKIGKQIDWALDI